MVSSQSLAGAARHYLVCVQPVREKQHARSAVQPPARHPQGDANEHSITCLSDSSRDLAYPYTSPSAKRMGLTGIAANIP